MVFNPCCRIPLTTGVLLVASVTIIVSVGKLILITMGFATDSHTHIIIDSISRKHFSNVTSHEVRDLEVFMANGVLAVEVLLNGINIIVASLLILNGVRKDCMWPINTFLLYSIMFFFFSLGTLNVETLLGIISNEVFALEAVSLLMDLYVILVANQACMEAWDGIRRSGIEANNNNITDPRDTSATQNIDIYDELNYA